jgi:predicted permease
VASNYFSATVAAALLVLGAASSRHPVSRRLSNAIASMLFYISVPLIVSYKVYSVEVETLADYAIVVVVSVLTAFTSAALLMPRLLRGAPPETIGAAILAAGIHNSAFLPIPLMLLLYDDAGPAALYSAVMNIVIAVVTPVVLGVYSPVHRGRGASRLRSIARSVASYPPVYALVAGLALKPLPPLPQTALELWGLLFTAGSYSTLLSFFLVGEVLARTGLRLDRGVLAVAAWRLAVEPTAAYMAVEALGLSGVWRAGAIIESMMPPATMNLVVAMMYRLDYGLVARSIGFVTPFSIAGAVLYRVFNP